MRKNYVKPNMVSYGACQTLIQGSCGWGIENFTLDKTGYTKKKWKVKTTQTKPALPCPGPDPDGKTNCGKTITTTVCKTETTCADRNMC